MEEKWYVGVVKGTPDLMAFSSDCIPSKETHGDRFGFFMGPFQSQLGAEYAAEVGPRVMLKTIYDYEREARKNHGIH